MAVAKASSRLGFHLVGHLPNSGTLKGSLPLYLCGFWAGLGQARTPARAGFRNFARYKKVLEPATGTRVVPEVSEGSGGSWKV